MFALGYGLCVYVNRVKLFVPAPPVEPIPVQIAKVPLSEMDMAKLQEEKLRLVAANEAFQNLMGYNVNTAYGLNADIMRRGGN